MTVPAAPVCTTTDAVLILAGVAASLVLLAALAAIHPDRGHLRRRR